MQINIPQYLRAQCRERNGTEERAVDVYIGEIVVHTALVDTWYEDEDAEVEAMNSFGTMLKLKIGD